MITGLRRLGLVLVLLSLAACAGNKPKRDARVTTPPASSSAATAGKTPETSLPQDRRYAQDQDGENPDRQVDIDSLPVPEPRDEPRSKYGNRSPYTVLGKSYDVLPTSKGYVERGIASWYGAKFHGYMTSSFEPYDMYAFSAAHKTLPLPSWVRVTNLANGKSVTVRVNDRGPFHQDRIIDLSYAAAARIGIWPAGTGRVEVRAVGPGDADAAPLPATTLAQASRPRGAREAGTRTRESARDTPARASTPALPAGTQVIAAAMPAPTTVQELPASTPAVPRREPGASPSAPGTPTLASPPAATTAGATPRLYVQVGAYGEAANAQRAADALTRAGLGAVQIVDAMVGGRHIRRVRLGPLKDADAADRLANEVRRLGLGNPQMAAD